MWPYKDVLGWQGFIFNLRNFKQKMTFDQVCFSSDHSQGEQAGNHSLEEPVL